VGAAGQPVSDGAVGAPRTAKTLTAAARKEARDNGFAFSVDRAKDLSLLTVRMIDRGGRPLANPTLKIWMPPRVTKVALAGDMIMRRNATLTSVPEEGAGQLRQVQEKTDSMLKIHRVERGNTALVVRCLTTALLVGGFALFAIAHFVAWRKTGDLNGLGLVLDEALLALLFLVRRSARRTSSAPGDWLLALGGTWLPLAMRPVDHASLGPSQLFLAVQLVGLAGALISLSTLGRSFGLVAADRGLQTSGPYAVFRHPAYLSYLVIQLGYLLQNPSPWNLAIVVAATGCQLGRIRAEERVMGVEAGYREYAARVRYRLIPALY